MGEVLKGASGLIKFINYLKHIYRLRRLGLHSEGTNALDRGPVPEIILYIKVFLGLI